jgi:PAS domain S-box-containing protein
VQEQQDPAVVGGRADLAGRIPGTLLAFALACHAVSALAFCLLPGEVARGLALTVAPLVAAITLAWGTRHHNPPRRWPWYALAAAQVASALGWAAWYLVLPHSYAVPGDVAFLAGYATAAVALVSLGGGLRRRPQLVALLDAGMLAVGLGILTWAFAVSRVAAAPGLSTTERVVAMAHPVFDVLVLAMAARLVFAGLGGGRIRLLLLWALCQGVGDLLYVLQVSEGSFRLGTPTFGFWLVASASLSCAALLPYRAGTRTGARRRASVRHLVVAAAVLPLPALLLVRAIQGSSEDVVLIAFGSVAMTFLALTRVVVLDSVDETPAVRAALRRSAVRLVAAFVALALLPLVGLTYVAVQESDRAMRQEVRERMAVTASVSSEYLNEQFISLSRLVTSYATRPSLLAALTRPGGADVAVLDRHVKALQLAHPNLFAAWVLGAPGDLLSFEPVTPSVMGRSYAGRDYYRGALTTNGAYVSEAFTAAAPGNPRAVGVSVAVRDRRGNVLGVVVVGYRLEAIRAFSRRLAEVQRVELTVTDQQGHLLSGAGSELPGLPSVSSDPRVRAALAGRSGTLGGTGADGPALSSYRPVDGLGWAVVAEVSERDAFAGSRRLAARVVAAAVLLVQLLLVGLILAVRADGRRRAAEATLADREEHLRSVLEAAGDAYVAIDADGRVTGWNAQATTVFGHDRATAMGRDVADLLIPSESREAHRAGLARVLGGGKSRLIGQRSEVDAVHADGHRFPAEITLWRSGTLAAPSFNAFVRDVTSLRVQERAVAEAHLAAVEASRLKSEFVANMSHEIRTPMNGVLGMTAQLRDTDLDPVQRDYADTIGGSAEALLTVIDDILDFSKIEAGKLDLEAVGFELRPIVEDVVGLLATVAATRGVEVVAWVDPAVPPFVHGDPHRLRQVLNNLVGNAVKYTERGEVVVHVVPAAQGAPFVQVAVRDTGIGITADQQVRLFEAFRQADASTTRRYGGTGLGLTISRQLVELMGGSLDLVSTPGEGSTFFFVLPLPAAQAAAPDKPKRPCMDGVRALVVDDNATNRKVMRQYLTAWALEPTCVADAESALTELRAAITRGTPYDVAVLDMHMPGTDGLALAHAILADPQLARTPMAMLTSSNNQGERAAAQAAGIGAYLTKPVREAQLFDRLSELLGGEEFDPSSTRPRMPVPAETANGRVLVAEDNEVNQRVVAGMLAQLGYDVDLAQDGRQAVEMVRAGHYDIVLMDCQMPVLDGFAATREIRAAQGPSSTTPIIALTASALTSDEQRCRAAGMDDFLSKPLRREALAAMLRGWTSAVPQEPSAPDVVADNSDVLDRGVLDGLLTLGSAFEAIVSLYLQHAPGRVGELQEAFDAHDLDAVGRVAHTLRGSSGSVGARRLAAVCAEIELAAKDGLVALPAMVARLHDEHDRAAAALLALLPGRGETADAGPGR